VLTLKLYDQGFVRVKLRLSAPARVECHASDTPAQTFLMRQLGFYDLRHRTAGLFGSRIAGTSLSADESILRRDPDPSLVETASICGLTKYKTSGAVLFHGRAARARAIVHRESLLLAGSR